MQGSPLVRRTNGDERRRIGDEREIFRGFFVFLLEATNGDERRRTATNGNFGGFSLRFGLLRIFGPEYFPTFISDSFWHTSLDNKHKHFKRVATYNHIWCPFKCFLSPGQRPKARGLRKISTSGMGKFFQKVFFSEKNLKMFQISNFFLPK